MGWPLSNDVPPPFDAEGVLVAFMLIVIIAAVGFGIHGCTVYSVKQLEVQQFAIEHGCSVIEDKITCAAGDRK